MPEQTPTRSARVATIIMAAMSLSVSAFGQSGQSSRQTGQSPGQTGQTLQTGGAGQPSSPAPAGPVRQLSVDEVVKLALEQNLGLQIERINPQIQDVSVAQSRSFWAPSLSTTLFKQSLTAQSLSSLSGAGGATTIQNSTFNSQVGMNQLLPWGGNYNATWNNQRITTTSLTSIFSPQLGSTLDLTCTQPLLRNFKIDNVRQTVALSKKTRDASDLQLHARIVQTTQAVKNAYWDLVYQIDNRRAVQQSLELAQQSLRDNTRRVEIGTMAPIDIVDAKAEVARNEEAVIVAQQQIEQAQDTLKTLIFDPKTPDFWNTTIQPTDTVPFEAQSIDTGAAVRNALEKRTDLLIAKNNMSQSDISLRFFRNQIMPDFNAQVDYRTTSAGGKQLSKVDPNTIVNGLATRTVIGERNFGTVLGDVFQSLYPQWTYSVQVGYPLGTSTARANLERAKLQYQQSQTQLQELQMQITAQVRNVARQVATNQKRVESARASRQLAEEKLAAEEKKFAAGIRETFFVFQAQRDLATARVAEVRATADYNKSLVDFEAVQEVAVGGGTSGVTTAGAGAIQTGNSAIIRQGG